MDEHANPLLVITGPAGHTFAVSQVPSTGAYVVEDPTRRLGWVKGDLTPFLVSIEESPYVIFVGPADHEVRHVVVELPGSLQTCRVRNRVWISFPEPFVPGMRVTAIWHAAAGVLFRCTSPPLQPDALKPIYGPGWTAYADG